MKTTKRKLSPNDYYSVEELCAIARVSKRTVWNWNQNRKFTTYKLNGALLFDASEVNRHIEESERKSYSKLKQAA